MSARQRTRWSVGGHVGTGDRADSENGGEADFADEGRGAKEEDGEVSNRQEEKVPEEMAGDFDCGSKEASIAELFECESKEASVVDGIGVEETNSGAQ